MDNKKGDIFRMRLRDEMNEKNLRQVDIVNRTGIPKSAINHYIQGNALPKQDRLYLIADAIGVDPAWLMGYDVPKTKEIDQIKRLDERIKLALKESLTVDAMREAQDIAQHYLVANNHVKKMILYALNCEKYLEKYEKEKNNED